MPVAKPLVNAMDEILGTYDADGGQVEDRSGLGRRDDRPAPQPA